ncbi:hypothetical protein F3157_04135 [Virgibacillus dakarensis]|uniref:Uncharacterized protein n=1 Tax=Lentibacillus populi TaxID=1827502 RepID=A0A9W5TV27_9BACI|nr:MULTISPECIES: hypothetical protein [Bacillaceae]MBT2214975.1 hypothetical protein [Virgibacillus dakarensis]MTW84846.1 hypothetical protein [Virgibacillus dakarensis]GGB31350.1 hypothetical protein GCM10011409_05900 [Lentibacillus populi]
MDETKNIDDYLYVISYRYDQKKVNKLNSHVDELEKSLIIMDKEKSKKTWNKVKKRWNELKADR